MAAGLELRSISKAFGGKVVLRGLDLRVPDGQLFVLLGGSGCGKTTTLRIIAGLEAADEGEIFISQRSVSSWTSRERNCGMVFQNYSLFPHLTVEENIGFGLRVRGVQRGERRERAIAIAQALGISELLSRRPGLLSGGEQQRVALARALVRRPSVLLLDEPLSNLDLRLRLDLRGEIRRIQKQWKVTMVYVTHDQTEAMAIADILGVMIGGSVAQIGSPFDVYARPETLSVARFLGAPPINEFSAEIVHGGNKHVVVNCDLARTRLENRGDSVPSREVVIAVRPEALKLVSPDDNGGIPGEVVSVEEQGFERLVTCEVRGRRCIARISTDCAVRLERPVKLKVDWSSALIFDRKSERLLEGIYVEGEQETTPKMGARRGGEAVCVQDLQYNRSGAIEGGRDRGYSRRRRSRSRNLA